MTSLSQFGMANRSYSFPTVVAKTFNGSLIRVRCPEYPSELICFKASSTNTGIIYIGSNDVSSAAGYPLSAGEVSPWFPVVNLNLFYYVCTVAADKLSCVVVY